MKFELNSYIKDSIDSVTGHSVYEFGSISQNLQATDAQNPPIYNKESSPRKVSFGSKEAMPFVVKKLIQMKVEAFTIKQLLN